MNNDIKTKSGEKDPIVSAEEDKKIADMKKVLFLTVIAVLLLIFFDQYTKLLATEHLKDKSNLVIIKNVLELNYLENTGAAFSLMHGVSNVFQNVMIIVTPLFCFLIAYFIIRLPKEKKFRPLYIDLLFVFSGALGNYIDRISHKYVVDFIYFSIIDFPVFNVADIYITCGFIYLIILLLFIYKDSDLKEIKLF